MRRKVFFALWEKTTFALKKIRFALPGFIRKSLSARKLDEMDWGDKRTEYPCGYDH